MLRYFQVKTSNGEKLKSTNLYELIHDINNMFACYVENLSDPQKLNDYTMKLSEVCVFDDGISNSPSIIIKPLDFVKWTNKSYENINATDYFVILLQLQTKLEQVKLKEKLFEKLK